MNDYTPATKIVSTNYRIEITPFTSKYGTFGGPADDATLRARCHELESLVSKHLSGDYEELRFEYDTETQCAHCDEPWEGATDEDGAPVCCGTAQSEYEAQTGKTVQ